ncbi:triacylglycerol lipase 2 [Eucalyptus grandis]|uniref:triacylglycerol lipase 2 n=1 Tax=Eucalyptus grandis TaxID=71139 RepID=UPI00192E8ADB|nr:triacylglycerol lipase 2 [Eucalyptus grandis]
MIWLLNPPEQDLPLILADNGFDVWMANSRGTRFSRRHTSLDPANPDFWNWSWDELAAFDIPAVFEFIHGQTGKKIDYVGHSLGTLTGLASISEGRLVDKLRSVALLGPVTYLSHMTTPLGVVLAKNSVDQIAMSLGLAEFNLGAKPLADLVQDFCHFPGVDCFNLLAAFTGSNCCLNDSTINLFLKNEPQSSSVKNMVHLGQLFRGGVLAKYDYGNASSNAAHYGDARPLVYNLSNIPRDLPIFLSYGGQDALSDKRDVQQQLESLKLHDAGKLTVQFIEDYAHADFVMGVNAKDIVFGPLLSFFKNQQ